ncbi:unnamed protein product, partial [Heterosigma akashiwo]
APSRSRSGRRQRSPVPAAPPPRSKRPWSTRRGMKVSRWWRTARPGAGAAPRTAPGWTLCWA